MFCTENYVAFATRVLVCLSIFILFMNIGVSASASELAEVVYQDHPHSIPGELIVTFESRESMNEAMQNTRNMGGEILHAYSSINGFATKTNDVSLRYLRTNNHVVNIEANMVVGVDQENNSDGTSPITRVDDVLNWGVDRIDGSLDDFYTYNKNLNGDGVNVYIFDSGIDDTTQDFWGGRITHAFDNVNDGLTRCGNHGTGVASIIGGETGVANGVTLHSVRVLNCNIVGNIADVLAGMMWVSDNIELPAVVNMSVATYDSTIYNHTVENMVEKGIPIVIAAGNDNRFDSCDVSPAGADGVITVGATDINDEIAWFNSFNDRGCINTYAPGVDLNVVSDDGDISASSGTSYSAPFVTGCIARYLQFNPAATPDDISVLIDTASSSGVLNCSFVDTMALESGLLETTPLIVSTNHVSVYQNNPINLLVITALIMVLTVGLYLNQRLDS